MASEVHARRMGLHHGCSAINVDYQAGQKVAFAMHQSESIVIRSEQSKCLPHFVGFGEAAKEKVAVDFRIVEGKNAHGNAPYLEMAVTNKVALMVVNRNQITFFHLIHPSYSAGKHPRMKTLERLFFAALQYYTFVNHGLFDKESVNIVGIRKEQESD